MSNCFTAAVSLQLYRIALGKNSILATQFLQLQLMDEAYQRWLVEEEGVVDDITAVVVKFVHPE